MKVTDYLNTMHQANFDVIVYENGHESKDKSVHMRWNLSKEALEKEWEKLKALYSQDVSWIGLTVSDDDTTVITLIVPEVES